jgi:hypothetical protein
MPLTEKRKKHLERQAKRKARLRTPEERLEKIDEVFDNFQRTGFPPTPEIKKFFQICKKWIDDGKLVQGIIPVPSLNIEICYTLNNSKLHDVGVMIRHTGQGPPPALGRPQEPIPVVEEPTETVSEYTVEEPTETVSEYTVEEPTETVSEHTVEELTETVSEHTVEESTETVSEHTVEELTEPVLSELDQIDDDEEDDIVPELVPTTENTIETTSDITVENSEAQQEPSILSKLTSMINPLNWTSNTK